MHAALVPVCLLLITPITSSWWAAGSNVLDPYQVCKKSKRLSKKMTDICTKKHDLLKQIKYGVNLMQRECQYQFRYRRWNCTTAKRSIRKVMLRDTRETGFVNALLAAGIAYQVTRACTTGELLGCSCDRRMKRGKKGKHRKKQRGEPLPEGEWEWEGCGGENIDFGIARSKDFLDTRYGKKRSDLKTLVKLHNYVAGRLAVKNYMRTECKCHGLSGSCTLKTCWRKMPQFREVGWRLRERFDGAAKVIPGNDGHRFQPEGETIKPPGRADLVYSEESADFCAAGQAMGSLGTRGRLCDERSQGEEGCAILCCGRGHATRHVAELENCNCRFRWCCDVQCDKCPVTRKYSNCL